MLVRLKGALDPYILALLATVAVATVLPARGGFTRLVDGASNAAIVVLFFLHGAKLSREAVLSGAGNWRLHAAALGTTFALFPLIGLILARMPGLPSSAGAGLQFLTLLPSTVQSSIAFTSIAGGNVAAAVCSASFSNLLGIFVTPLLVTLLMGGSGAGVSWIAVQKILLQLLVPFAVGHALRPVVGAWVARHRALVSYVDRGSILLIVYAAFSAAVVGGLWQQVPAWLVGVLIGLSLILLVVVLGLTWLVGELLGLAREDRIVLLFCGSKKSLATGVPIAGVLFPATQVGLVILPVIIFHQIQLIACAIIARGMARKSGLG